MWLSKIKFLLSVSVIFSLALILFGCEEQWMIFVIDNDKENPEFCFSAAPECIGPAVQLKTIVFQEVDRKGVFGKKIWVIGGKSNVEGDYRIKTLRYGTVPRGWEEFHA